MDGNDGWSAFFTRGGDVPVNNTVTRPPSHNNGRDHSLVFASPSPPFHTSPHPHPKSMPSCNEC